MIDKKYKQTKDAFNPKRGRPVTGNAKSAADRKRAQRERDRQLAAAENFTESTLTGLIEELQRKVALGDVDAVKGINSELLKRTRKIFKSNM